VARQLEITLYFAVLDNRLLTARPLTCRNVRVGGRAMKIYILLMLIAIVGVSNLPLRKPAKASVQLPNESVSVSF
jgi:hypothetical protein